MNNLLTVTVKLSNLHCFDEADGPGTAEPYLWTLFFKVDGETVRLNDQAALEGVAVVDRRNGAHGNLLHTNVDAGNDLPIPPAIGEWTTTLKPIPLSDAAKGILQPVSPGIVDLPATIGVLCVLMEEDGLTDSSVLAGYDALASAFTSELNQQISFVNMAHQEIDNEAINEAIGKAVEAAVRSNLNGFETIWAGIVGPDQQIGSENFTFKSDTIVTTQPTSLSKRWSSDAGDWEITGEIMAKIIPGFGDHFQPSGKEPGLKGVKVYEDWKYNRESLQSLGPFSRARSQQFDEGVYNLPYEPDLPGRRFGRLLGVRPNAISSIKVGEGYFCELFDGPDQTGSRLEVAGNAEVLPPAWNDKAVCLVVSKTGVPH